MVGAAHNKPATPKPDCDYGRQYRVKAGKRALTRHCRPCSGFVSGLREGSGWVPVTLQRAGSALGQKATLRAVFSAAKPFTHRDCTFAASAAEGFAFLHDVPGPWPDISSVHGPL